LQALTYTFVGLEDPLLPEVDRYLNAAHGATIFHTSAWNRIVRDVFATQFMYAIALGSNGLAAVMPCHWVSVRRGMPVCYSPPSAYETPYGGPVGVDNAVCAELVRVASRRVLGGAVDVCAAPPGSSWVKIGPWRRIVPAETVYVDLTMPLDSIWTTSLDGKRRNMIRKAQRAGVEIRAGGPELLDTYYTLVQQTVIRAGIALHPIESYRRVVEVFGAAGLALLLVAYVNGRAVSGGIFLRFRNSAYYWHGATATGAPNEGQGELLQWQAIKWAHEAGCSVYDLVVIERNRLPHIARFKLGFSQNIVPFYSVVHTRSLDRVVRRLVRMTSEFSLQNRG